MILNISQKTISSNGKSSRIMNRNHYPKNWNKITRELKKEANYRCQHCGVKDGSFGYRNAIGDFIEVNDSFIKDLNIKTSPIIIKSQYLNIKLVKINLQAAHIIHNKDHSKKNLLCLCERCHGIFDSDYHIRVKNYKNFKLKEEKGQLKLFNE